VRARHPPREGHGATREPPRPTPHPRIRDASHMSVTLTPAQRAEERAAQNAARWHVLGFNDGAICEKHWPRPAGQPDGYKRARLHCLAIPHRHAPRTRPHARPRRHHRRHPGDMKVVAFDAAHSPGIGSPPDAPRRSQTHGLLADGSPLRGASSGSTRGHKPTGCYRATHRPSGSVGATAGSGRQVTRMQIATPPLPAGRPSSLRSGSPSRADTSPRTSPQNSWGVPR
jgi:hypothetical protein